MEVTPHITSDNQVFLALKVSNNRPDFSNLVQGQPAIQVKEAQTEVLIADGDTTVIGGVFSSAIAGCLLGEDEEHHKRHHKPFSHHDLEYYTLEQELAMIRV